MPTEPRDINVKFSALERTAGAEPGYRLICYPRLTGGAWSKYATLKMFVHGNEEQPKAEIGALLATLNEGAFLDLRITSGNLRQNKVDDGAFASYFWNVTHLLKVGGAPVKREDVPQETGGSRQPALMDGPPEDELPAGEPRSAPSGPREVQGPIPPGSVLAKMDTTKASITASWSINQAREMLQSSTQPPDWAESPPTEDVRLAAINNLAIRFIKMQALLADRLVKGTIK